MLRCFKTKFCVMIGYKMNFQLKVQAYNKHDLSDYRLNFLSMQNIIICDVQANAPWRKVADGKVLTRGTSQKRVDAWKRTKCTDTRAQGKKYCCQSAMASVLKWAPRQILQRDRVKVITQKQEQWNKSAHARTQMRECRQKCKDETVLTLTGQRVWHAEA